MADYTLSVVVTATAKKFESTFASAEATVGKLGKTMEGVGKSITSVTTKIGTALGGLSGAVIKVGSDFEAQMSRVEAISGATAEEFDALREQALQLGADTAFSASEAAEGMENLAAAGFDTTEIMEAMPGLLELAAASGEDLAASSDIAASTLRGFGLEASEAAHVADVLAENANRTNSSVYETGEAMKYVAPMARACGLSMEETAAAIGLMANAGIQGSQAGTTLRGALSRLSKPTKAMNEAMEELGISFYDAEGTMKPLSEQISMLEGAMAGLTDEERNNYLVTLYGQEALSGMLALIQTGPDELNALTESFKSCDGAAGEAAATMQDNLQGSLEQLGGALETLGIRVYDEFAEPLTDAVDMAADAVSRIGDAFAEGGLSGAIDEIRDISPALDDVIGRVEDFADTLEGLGINPAQFAVAVAAAGPLLTVLGKITSVAGGAFGAISTLGSVVASISSSMGTFATAMRLAGTNGTVLSGVLATLTSPVGLVLTAVTGLAAAFTYLMATNDGFRESVMTTVGYIISSLQPVLTQLMTLLSTVGQIILSTVGSALQQLAPVILQVVIFVGQLVGALAPLIEQLINSLAPIIVEIISTVSEIIDALLPPLIEVIGAVMDAVEQLMPPIQRVLTTATDVIAGIMDVVSPIVGFIGDIIAGIMDIIAPIISFIADIISGVMDLVTPLVDFFSSIFSGIFGAVSEKMTQVGNVIGEIFTGVQEKWNELTGFVSGVIDGIAGAFNSVVDTIKGVINKVIGGINTAIGVINKIPGVEISQIAYLAHGTDNWPGGFAYVNEGGRGELMYLPNGAQVIPHDVSMRYAKEAARINATVDVADRQQPQRPNVYQTINFNQPAQSPVEVYRAMKRAGKELAYV